MKNTIFALFAVLAIATASGCATGVGDKGCALGCNGGCNKCGLESAYRGAVEQYGQLPGQKTDGAVVRGNLGREYKHTRQFNGPHGPPSGAITYPYYTTRAPRDYLARNPAPIGP
jgi:hypothetical protein